MSQECLIIVVCSLLIQLGMSYIRTVPFARVIDSRTKKRLVWCFALCTVFSGIWMSLLMMEMGYTVRPYKLCAIVGWIPYVAAPLFIIRGYGAQQIFIAGMSGFWYILLHSLAAIAPVLLFPNTPREDLLDEQMISYVLLLFLLLPLLRYMFRDLLPSKYFMNEKPYSYYIAVLPITICLAQVPGSMNDVLWGPYRLVGRLLMLTCFLVLWRYIVLAGREVEKEVEKESAHTLAQKAIHFFQHTEVLNQSRMKEMSIFRHDVRHHLGVIYSLACAGRTQEIKSLIDSLDEELSKTAVHAYCLNPIINAVVSIYFARAESEGIQLTQKLSVPEHMGGVENEMAFFLANLLENAMHAACAMPKNQRFMNVVCVVKGGQVALSIENTHKGILKLGKDGFPVPSTHENGHGIGTLSIARFISRYHVIKSYTQKGDHVTFTAYFNLPGGKA